MINFIAILLSCSQMYFDLTHPSLPPKKMKNHLQFMQNV
ncbi:hypothetical protein LEP1GSC195_3722 [Leptospira wolbachii serovar Codice str. CDC]|uniref:Uncharacterized protein n=1 Tax=Leptospira wolbachii serovar Codice str. CDC TaxID=1218599 RepID=R9A0Z7_9LEPT|nr:hypothetical protein LEP1GSC195_3722 [Leptospira wolbachii serovar Codice str. CDC]